MGMPKVGQRYRVQFRRKREGKTDYRRRLKLLRSGMPRLVARVSSEHVHAQVSKASPVGDITLASAHSKQLAKYGWKGGTCNLPSAYLVGLLCGHRAVRANVTECILDIGIHKPVRGSRVFAVLKGAADAGVRISHGEGVLPGEERISGTHIARYAGELRERAPEAHRARFSGYLSRGLSPERLPEHFREVKQNILAEFGGSG
jgi:large subunit ribosomal protein L18